MRMGMCVFHESRWKIWENGAWAIDGTEFEEIFHGVER